MATPPIHSLEKALKVLQCVAARGRGLSVSALAAELRMPISTAYRIVTTFERCGFLIRVRRGDYLTGPALLRLANAQGLNQVLEAIGRAVIEKLAKTTRCTAHLGVFEGGMVTYLLKAVRGGDNLFTREGTQLEAYCTGIGKVLLAALPEPQLVEYFANGPFIALTPNTLTDRQALRKALNDVRRRGYATDNGEMDPDLKCFAIPIYDSSGTVVAAASISSRRQHGGDESLRAHLAELRKAAMAIGQRL